MKVNLLIIDPQNDFCDSRGSLFVKGADYDMKRLADMIRANRGKIAEVDVTLDSHRWLHIAHPIFWADEKGSRPKAFTKIRLSDIESKQWKTRLPGYDEYVLKYVKYIEENTAYELTIWPPHCLIGSWGHCVFPPVLDSILYFEESFKRVNYHLKGANPYTEHYSAIKPAFDEYGSHINQWLLDRLTESDRVVVAGEALTHCVKSTVLDVIEKLGGDFARKLVVLKDATSAISGYEEKAQEFLEDLKAIGAQILTTENCFSS